MHWSLEIVRLFLKTFSYTVSAKLPSFSRFYKAVIRFNRIVEMNLLFFYSNFEAIIRTILNIISHVVFV